MQTYLGHMQFNVEPSNVPFYKDLLTTLGWQILYETEGMLGVADKNGVSLWFVGQTKAVSNDYDGPGMNHLAISTAAQADVDAAAAYLSEHDVELLFDTPRHRAEFSQSEEETYYQVMFETPDRILLEVVYTGPKSV
ncbi:MAG TPA: VOC family protein [Roseiflexaceae bacterium]|jgi:catechol 2,3-dioxygenase-like lactoylglutathione lyase family enzyme|nr:VOC family protein [Roseiflexaceae bacterium]